MFNGMFNGMFPERVFQDENYTQSPTGWPRTIVYERTLVPYVMPDLPVSPPGSPRGSDEEDDYVPEYDWKYELVEVRDWQALCRPRETAFQIFPNNSKRKNISKNMRRMGKLKQPGGSSCNQRR